MTKKEAMKLIASHYERIKKIVLMSENKYFPNNKGCYHEDITQDLFVKIQKEIEEIPNNKLEISKFLDRYVYGQSYIYQSIKQLLVNTLRRDSKYTRLTYSSLSSSVKRNLIEEIKLKDEESIQEKVDKYVDSFYWFDKKVFNLYRYEFKTHPRAMSKKTKLSESTIYRTVKRCKIKINEKLKDQYYEK